jgi:hypothetical protein
MSFKRDKSKGKKDKCKVMVKDHKLCNKQLDANLVCPVHGAYKRPER